MRQKKLKKKKVRGRNEVLVMKELSVTQVMVMSRYMDKLVWRY